MAQEFVTKQRFLHLLPAEKVLWQKWLSQFENAWEKYEYDVHVGKGLPYVGEGPEWAQSLVTLLTQKRIDVIAWRGTTLWIFEVKPGAAMSAYGELLAYRELYRTTFKYDGPIELAIVTDFLGPDDDYLFLKAGIHVFLV